MRLTREVRELVANSKTFWTNANEQRKRNKKLAGAMRENGVHATAELALLEAVT